MRQLPASTSERNVFALGTMTLLVCISSGCTTAVKIGVKLVGEVVHEVDVDKKGERLVGQAPEAADRELGEPLDLLREEGGNRQWRLYSVDMDVFKKFRYVVEVSDNKIQALTKAHLTKSKLDILRKLSLKDKCEGKSPRECEAILQMGPPILAARSEKSGKLVQLYDSGGIEIAGISEPTYCRLWYDEQEVFEDLEIITATSSTKEEPTK